MIDSLIDLPTYEQTTNNVKIIVKPEFRPELSDPINRSYSFAYHIQILNNGAQSVQLMERHWKIFSAGVQIGEVMGPGVVGQQPIIESGANYHYSSGADIKDPVGYMEGTYTFKDHNNQTFLVAIPRFHLVYPMAIN